MGSGGTRAVLQVVCEQCSHVALVDFIAIAIVKRDGALELLGLEFLPLILERHELILV